MLIKNADMLSSGSLERNKDIGPTQIEEAQRSEFRPKNFDTDTASSGGKRIITKLSGRSNTTRGRASSMKKSASTESNSTAGPSSQGGVFSKIS